jgi:hypothetical protein
MESFPDSSSDVQFEDSPPPQRALSLCGAAKRARQTDLEQLVKRRCRCKAEDCLTQFREHGGDIRAARDELRSFEPAMREVHMGLILNLTPPQLQLMHSSSSIGVGDVFLDEDVSDSSASQFGDDSDVEQARAKRGRACETEGAFGDESDTELPQEKRARTYKARAHTGTILRTKTFQGKRVCMWALQKLYGIGDSMAQTLRHGGRSQRPGDRKEPKHPDLGFSMLLKPCHVWPTVLMFFWLLYHSVAEGLPEGVVQMERLADSAHTAGDGHPERARRVLPRFFTQTVGRTFQPTDAVAVSRYSLQRRCVCVFASRHRRRRGTRDGYGRGRAYECCPTVSWVGGTSGEPSHR